MRHDNEDDYMSIMLDVLKERGEFLSSEGYSLLRLHHKINMNRF